MSHTSVSVQRIIPVRATDVWAVAGNFCGHWHPFVDWIRSERDPSGRLVRCFVVKGEQGHYHEVLTYHSKSDMTLRYLMLEGIIGAQSYSAEITVEAVDTTKSKVTWRADIEAGDEDRARQIADGTETVFEAGMAALSQAPETMPVEFRMDLPPAKLDTMLIDGLALACGEARPGPLLLFLHGIGGNRQNWQSQQQVCRQLQTAALDFRGYGDSALGPRQTLINDHCDDILRVMNALGKEQVILCGLSFGSWIATSFAMRHPDKLAGLVLSGGCTGMSEAPLEEREAFFRSRQKPLDEGKTPADFADAVVNIIAGPKASELVRMELRSSMAAIPAATYRDAVYCFTHPENKFDFSRISCPVLLMTGEHDRLAPPAEIRAVANRIYAGSPRPDVRFEVIANAGHVCNLETPDQYNDFLTDFLQRFTS